MLWTKIKCFFFLVIQAVFNTLLCVILHLTLLLMLETSHLLVEVACKCRLSDFCMTGFHLQSQGS